MCICIYLVSLGKNFKYFRKGNNLIRNFFLSYSNERRNFDRTKKWEDSEESQFYFLIPLLDLDSKRATKIRFKTRGTRAFR